MTSQTANGSRLLTFENPLPSENISEYDRERNLALVHNYVIKGEPLDGSAIDDMFANPEALSSQMEALEGWVEAAKCGEDGLTTEQGADKRLKFLSILLNWSVEMGNGSTDTLADRTSGNGSDGLPLCTSSQIGVQEGRRHLTGVGIIY